MLAIAGAMAVGGYLYFRLDDEIRRQVERRLADYYRDFDVRVGSARFDADRGIAIGNCSLTPKVSDGSSQPVLAIEDMYMAGKMRMDQLVTGQMQIDDITVRGAKLRLVRQTDGQWNAHALLPLPHFGKKSPRIKIEDASGTVEDATIPDSKAWVVNGVNLQLSAMPTSGVAGDAEKRFHLEGTANGLPAQAIRIEGEVGTANGEFDVSVAAEGLEISPEMLANLSGSTANRMHGLELSGRSDVTVKLRRANDTEAVDWSAEMKLDRGRIAHPRLPAPLTEVSLVGHADRSRLLVERLNGRCESASVAAAFDRAGWSENAPLGLAAKVVGLTVDDRMRSALSESCSKVWDRFKPAGIVDAEVRLKFDGEKCRPVIIADCRGISLTDAEKFPYPLEQTTGRVEYHPAENGRPDQLRLDLTGVGGGRPIKVEAELTHVVRAETEGLTTATGVAAADTSDAAGARAAGYRGVRFASVETPSHPLGYVKVSGTDVPLHEQLLAALPKERAQPFVRSLHAQGAIDFVFRSEWKDLSQQRPDITQEIRLKDCRLQYERFAYPLQHVQGVVTSHNLQWTLQDIEGRGVSNATIVTCSGEATQERAGLAVDLNFDAKNVPLDDTLKLSLTPVGQQAWSELRPQGRVDFKAHAMKQADRPEPEVAVVMQPRDRSVSVEPVSLPYRLEQIEGQASYQRDHLQLQNVVARHDRTQYSAESGTWQAAPDGTWQIALTKVNADRLVITRDLLAALPPGLQATIDRFQPTGTFGLYNSNLSFFKSPQVEGVASAWDVNLECQQAAIQGAVPLRGVTGGLHVVCRSDRGHATVAGELAIDSLLWKDVQLTNVRGPLWADGSHLLLGEPACRQQNQPPRRLTADAYGGSIATNIELMQDVNPSYNVDLHVGGVSLARFANERLGGPKDMSGTVSGKLVAAGTGRTTETLRGAGELHVVDGRIYQLPPLVSMLKVLSNRPPDTTAFNRCDMKFAIQGQYIHFEQLNLLGDAVSLYGNGEVDFNRKLNLVFYTLIGPTDVPIPFLKTIASHMSQQGLQLKVVGTFDHPETERKALPAVNDMLDHIQNGLQEGAATMSPATAVLGPRGATR